MKAPSLTEVFRLNEDPAATGAAAHLSLVRVKYNNAKDIFALGLCHLFLHGALKGKCNKAITMQIAEIEKAILGGDVSDAARRMDSFGDIRFVDAGLDQDDGAGLDAQQDYGLAACGSFFETYRWITGGGGSPIGALDSLSKFAKDPQSGRLFSQSDEKEIGSWDTPKKVGSRHMLAGDFLLRLEGGRYDRAWRVDLVAADSSAADEDRVAADQASEQPIY